MKKIVSSFISLFLCVLLSAEVPSFLQNWIFPKKYDFSSFQYIPAVPGSPFEQISNTRTRESWFKISNTEDSKGVIPPYFIKKGLFNWNDDYDKVYMNLVVDRTFSVYKDVTVEKITDSNNHQELKFLKRLVVQNDKARPFFICLLFSKDNDYKLSNITIQYRESKKDTTLDPHMSFERYNRQYWYDFSNIEQKAFAFAGDVFIDLGYSVSDLNSSGQNNDSIKRGKDYLSGWNITDRKSLSEVIKNDSYFYNPEYKYYLQMLENNKEDELFDIAEKNNLTLKQVCKLVFVQEMKDTLGEYGIEAFDDALKIALTQMGVFCGYLSRKEGTALAEPIVKEVSQKYVDYEDYLSHLYAGRSFSGVNSDSYLTRVYNSIDRLYALYSGVPTPMFDATNADKSHQMDFSISWFSPSQKYQKLFDAQNADISKVEEAVAEYGPRKFLTKILNEKNIIRYNKNVYGNSTNFFEKTYRQIWEELPEIEKYAVAFSSNLMLLNNFYPLDFNCKLNFQDENHSCAKILKESWDISDYKSLTGNFKQLQEGGHSGSYKKLEAMLEKYPEKTELEIAEIEGLTYLEISRLYFVNQMRTKLGTHGIEAWDSGRSINILRWGIGAGYITKEEALTLIEPVIAKIRSDYTSFYDYMGHYIAGRAFFGLGSLDYKKMIERATFENDIYEAYFPISELDFTMENADTDHVYLKADYTPTEEALHWEKVIALNNSNYTTEQFYALEKEFPKLPCLIYNHFTVLTDDKKDKEALDYIKDNINIFKAFTPDNTLYMNAQYRYMVLLNNMYQPKECLAEFDTLPLELQENLYIFFQRAYANYLLANIAEDFESRTIYQSRAVHDFKKLTQRGFPIGNLLLNWVKNVDLLTN